MKNDKVTLTVWREKNKHKLIPVISLWFTFRKLNIQCVFMLTHSRHGHANEPPLKQKVHANLYLDHWEVILWVFSDGEQSGTSSPSPISGFWLTRVLPGGSSASSIPPLKARCIYSCRSFEHCFNKLRWLRVGHYKYKVSGYSMVSWSCLEMVSYAKSYCNWNLYSTSNMTSRGYSLWH